MGDIVWHGHHEGGCPLEHLIGTIEERRQEIIAQKPRDEHELRLRLLRPASPEAVEAWRAYRAAVAIAQAAYDEAVAPAKSAYDEAVEAWAASAAWAAHEEATAPVRAAYRAALASTQAAYDAAVTTALQPILALHATECPDCPWDGHSIFGGRA